MQWRRVSGTLALAMGLAGLVCPAERAEAETTNTLQVQVTSYLASSQRLEAGDEEGHILGVGQRSGEAVFSNQETARFTTAFTFDSRRGQGMPSEGYTKFTFQDGSWVFLTWKAQTTMASDGLAATTGQGTIMCGKGRFAGIKGNAVFHGREERPAERNPMHTTLLEGSLTYTLP